VFEQQKTGDFMKRLPDIETITSILSLDFKTGVLFWNFRKENGSKAVKAWNTRYAGRPAGNAQERGYLSIRINNKSYLAHRIVYLIATGIDPIGFDIDHIDGSTLNNSPSNLRMVSHSENLFNRKGASASSSTGVRNVYQSKTRNGFFAHFIKDGEKHWVGSFKDVLSAQLAVNSAVKKKVSIT
jgi:hypothetical protein